MTRTPLRILVCALGGEGGGVLMNWIVAAARAAGCGVQATSVPGVAQRTGSTSYYIEVATGGAPAVLSLVPVAGRVDVVLASELVEAGRAIEQGFVSPERTTLIASTSRVLATAERIRMGDGRHDGGAVLRAGKSLARAAHFLDMQKMAERNGTFVSATMYGALTGSGVLPWSEEVSLSVLGSGPAAEANLRGARAAAAAVAGDAPEPAETSDAAAPIAGPVLVPGLPEGLAKIVSLGAERTRDYQDEAYCRLYLDRVTGLAGVGDPADPVRLHALTEAARRLALWMCYEDIARVADLKSRVARFARIRAECRAEAGQLVRITEYLRPRAAEIADVLPAVAGRRLAARAAAGRWVPFAGHAMRLRSNGGLGFWVLRLLAQLRRTRRGSLRYAAEQAAIEAWLKNLKAVLAEAPAFAAALAELPRLRKGYSDTMQRGVRAHDQIMQAVVVPAVGRGPDDADTDRLRQVIGAAMADEDHAAFDAALAGNTARPVPRLKPASGAADAH